jgi:deoxyribodipyrimidine photo-lyase
VVGFVFDTTILRDLRDKDDTRVTFIHDSVMEVDRGLAEHGSRLMVRFGDPVEEIPRLAAELGVDAVFTGRDYEPYASRRDAEVAQRLECPFVTLKDHVIFEAGEVLTQGGDPFRVYSPYARAWRARFRPEVDAAEAVVDPAAFAKNLELHVQDWPLEKMGFVRGEPWTPGGEAAGREKLRAFARKIGRYAANRDFPTRDATSGLSVHLRFGTVSTREAFRVALAEGGDKWMSELIWREFYQDILANHPDVVVTTFNPAYRDLEFPGSDEHYQAWEDGLTGYPIVDAAMRCLNQTGWMHNRLRMVVAMFLTKDLLVDYRRGEAHFARKLLDFDLAQNNGGWQWSASVGADAAPYFRVFNPYLQSEKFDPEGEFIAEWVPELAGLPAHQRHRPHEVSPMELLAAGIELGKTYPYPIVDHAAQKDLAIKLFSDLRGS